MLGMFAPLVLLLAAQAAFVNARVYLRDNTTTVHVQITSTLLSTSTVRPNATSPVTTALDYASSCAAAKNSWIAANGTTATGSSVYVTTSSTLYSYSTLSTITYTTTENSTVFTLCDGYPRLHAGTSEKTVTTTVSSWLTSRPATITTFLTSDLPMPTCSIGSVGCQSLQNEYSAWQADYNSSESAYSSWFDNPHPTGTVLSPNSTSSTVFCGKPTLTPAPVTVIGDPVLSLIHI